MNKSQFAEWPLPRCDQRLTGRSSGVGKITDPKVVGKWEDTKEGTVNVWTHDINFDGQDELVVLTDGVLQAFDLSGSLLWKSSVGGSVRAFCDFTGDGTDTHILLLEGAVNLVILSGKTGEVCWKYTLPLENATAPSKICAGPLDPNRKGNQIALFGEFGYFFSFENGFQATEPLWKICRGREDLGYPPVVVTGDIRGNGKPDILNVCHDHVEVYDTSNGELVCIAHGKDVRNYGFSGLYDVDGDGILEFINVNNCVEIHAWVADFKDGKFQMSWDNDYGYDKTEMHFPTVPVADADNDGKLNIFFTTIDTDVTELTARVLSAETGEELYSIKDRKIIHVGDLDDDGLNEIVFEDPSKNRIELCRLENGSIDLLATVEGDALQYSRQEYDSMTLNHSQYSSIDYCDLHFFSADIDGDGKKENMIYTSKGIEFFTLEADHSISMKYHIENSQEMEFLQFIYQADLHRYAVLCRHHNTLKVFSISDSGETLLFSLPVTLSKTITAVTAANVEGYPYQLISVDNNLLLPEPSSDGNIGFSELKTFYSSNKGIQYAPGLPTGMVHLSVSPWDINQDGTMEYLYVGPGALIELYDNDFHLLWRNYLGKFQKRGKIMTFTFGHYTSKDHYDILCVFTESEMHRNSMILVDGLTGEVIWKLKRDGHERGNGAIWGYMATYPLQEDGLDDTTYIGSYYLLEVDGKTGSLLHEKQNLPQILYPLWKDNGPSWVGYGHCAIVDVDGCGSEEIILHGVMYIENGVLKRSSETGLWEPMWCYGDREKYQSRGAYEGIAKDQNGAYYLGSLYADYSYRCCEAVSGKELWSIPLHSLTSTTAVADIDGDGEEEFIFTTSTGILYAVGISGKIKFKSDLGISATQVILSDIDHDGNLEILLTSGNSLYLVK